MKVNSRYWRCLRLTNAATDFAKCPLKFSWSSMCPSVQTGPVPFCSSKIWAGKAASEKSRMLPWAWVANADGTFRGWATPGPQLQCSIDREALARLPLLRVKRALSHGLCACCEQVHSSTDRNSYPHSLWLTTKSLAMPASVACRIPFKSVWLLSSQMKSCCPSKTDALTSHSPAAQSRCQPPMEADDARESGLFPRCCT